MDLIYHANCLDGSLCSSIILFYNHLYTNQFMGDSPDSFFDKVIKYSSQLNDFTIIDNIDYEAWQKQAENNCTGELDFLSFAEIPYSQDPSISLSGLEVNKYDYHFNRLYKKAVLKNDPIKDLLIVVDASGSYENIKRLSKFYKSILLIDHHQSFKKEFPKYTANPIENVRIVYSNVFCASTLTYSVMKDIFGDIWKFFNNEKSKDILKKIEYINRNDTSVPDDDETNSFIEAARMLQIHKLESLSAKHIFKVFNYSASTLIQMGRPCLYKKNTIVNKSISHCNQMRILRKFEDKEPMFVQCYGKFIEPGFRYLSETGKRLAERSFKDIGTGLAIIIRGQDEGYYISLRSIEADDFDCEELASYFNGGGHKRAAGCFMSKKMFNDHFRIVKIVTS
jgi:hypothetical protein